MNQSSLHIDDDQDSLFGSPPPSPARGRSPSQETFIAGEGIGPIIAVPSTGAGRKNVGTIALPGSHMSCAELPADLSASSLSLPRPTSSHDSLSITPPSIAGTPTSLHTPVVASRSSTRSVPSRASSAASNIHSTSTSTRKRRTLKAKSVTPAPPAPPITLPGPNEPTPPNLLRSQSSLLGLAGLHVPVQQSRSHSPICGSTPAHPIVLDDDQDTPHIGKHHCDQLQTPQHVDQLNPEIMRSNILNSLTREKNVFPVLESLIKLLGGEPHLSSANPPPQPFARPYGHGVLNTQPPLPVASLSAPGSSTAPAIPPQKRRKLKHVPAGAVDWDVPFPFAAGEGPEAYHDTWARDRAKQLVTQLLELVQNATKRAAIKTAKSRIKASEGRTRAQSSQSSRSASVETQIGQSNSTASSHPRILIHQPEPRSSGYWDANGQPSSKDRMPMELEGAVGAGSMPCDYSAFEEWLSQLQQFVPLETNTPTPESDWGTPPAVPLDSSACNPAPNIPVPMQRDTLTAPHAIRDEAIDPALLAISQRAGSSRRSESPTSPASALTSGDIAQMLDISPTPPVLSHSPRTSLSSLTEPLTPCSEAFADIPTSMIANQDLVHDPPTPQPVEKDPHSRPANQVQAPTLSSSPTEPSEPTCITAVQKGKGRADFSVPSPAPSTSNRSTPNVVSTAKGALDKQGILERARERRRQLVAEIERAKVEIWEMSIENAVLVHFMRDGSL
ncbi:hypothetical protein J3R82DRAFT_11406 [Butyriboletus roseoflavus]|nr:hypothetical protein J3R82DRAFT_11406 [Butyriboletus roseoflavus]